MQKISEHLNDNQQQQENNNTRIFFKLLQKVGVFGKYQFITIVLWCSIMYLNGGLMFMTPFLFYQDPYVCPLNPNEAECKTFVCALSQMERIYYQPNGQMIHSLANHFGDYKCPSDKLSFDTLIAMMFFGAAVGFLCLTLLGEMVGRKLLIQINLASFIIGVALIIFSVNLYMAAAGLFLSALGINNSYIICFYFIIETVSDDYREKVSVVCQTFYGVGVMLDILWYWWIADWQIILGACFGIPAVIVFIVLTIFIKDTPTCLVLRNTSEQALKDFNFIAKMNGVEAAILQQEIIDAKQHYEFSLEKTNNKKFTVIDLFKYKSTRIISLLLFIIFCTVCFAFYAPSLMLSQFELDIFLNGLALGISQTIAYCGTFFLVERFKRKLIAYICFGVTATCSLALIFVWDQGGDGQTSTLNQITILILVFLFQLAISVEFNIFFIYQNQLYPTQARVIGTGIVSLAGEAVIIFASAILDFCFEINFPVMIIFVTLTVFCIFISFYLPETFKKVPQELILQFRQKSSQYKSKLSSKKDIITSGYSRGAISAH